MLGAFCMLYAVPRFFFEYLRWEETDPRYAGLTPAQWFSIAAFTAGATLVYRAYKKGKPAPADYTAYDVYLESEKTEPKTED